MLIIYDLKNNRERSDENRKRVEEMEPLLSYIADDKYTSESLEDYQKSFTSKIAAK